MVDVVLRIRVIEIYRLPIDQTQLSLYLLDMEPTNCLIVHIPVF
jgi:hypothetical protein